MRIYSNGLIILDYDPATDILTVALPDIRKFGVSEVERSLEIVVENIVNYDIKKMLLDSSKAVIEVDDVAYRNLITKFSYNLMKTRLQKLARVGSVVKAQEDRATNLTEEIRHEMQLPIDFKNFYSQSEAFAWLKESD